MSDQVKQVVITQQDIRDNRYIFGPDVITTAKTGVSKTGSAEAQSSTPESKFNARYHYEGATLLDLQPLTDYKLGVNLRASLRGTGKRPAWIPPVNTPVDVFVTDKGMVQIKNLPVEAQVEMLIGGIDDPNVKQKARKALLATL